MQNLIKFFIPLFIGGGIIWYLYKGQDIKQILNVLHSGIKWEWIFLSLLLAILSHVARAYRWRIQLKALDVTPSLFDLSNSVFGNYGVNLIFPRLGELWRCNFISKKTQKPFVTIFGSILSERLLDLISVTSITIFAFILERKVFISFFKEHPTIADTILKILVSPITFSILIISIVLILVFKKRFTKTKIYQKFHAMIMNAWQGFETIRTMKNKWSYIFLTFGIWLLYFLNFYVCIFAFDFSKDIGIVGALTMFVMGSIGVVVPVQGGTGPWHFMIISTMLLYGVSQTNASTFALIVHAIQQGFVIILGLYTMLAIFIADRLRKRVQITV